MAKISKYYGKLSPELLKDLDALILKLKEINKVNKVGKGRKIVRRSEIVPLPEDEYVRLWGYLRHCCLLAANWKNIRDAIKVVADSSGRSFEDVQAECVETMTIHVYTYVWRHYEHSEECNYVFTTATFGYKSWIEEQNCYIAGIEAARKMTEKDDVGHKVTTRNFD